MEFYTSSGFERPIRLSDKTRRFAYESLNHKYGLDTLKVMNISLDHIENYEDMSELEKYNTAIFEIVTKAPIRICKDELISGAATLGDAIFHKLPVTYKGNGFGTESGISHLTVDFFEVLKIGMNGIRKNAENALSKHTDPSKQEFVKSCIHCIDCMKIWHQRYIDALSKSSGYDNNIKNLLTVPFSPAANFYEAVQSLWFCFAFLRLCGCWSGIGRIDHLLGSYLEADLKNGILTLDEAREILTHFFIKGCEWINGNVCESGDAQHYQNIILSGIDSDGNDVTNDVTYLCLDIIEETGISDFPTTVRINKNTDEALLTRTVEVIRLGGGIIAFYNEDLILESLENMGYPQKEAREFANDGCWEIIIPGKTNFNYLAFDALKILQEDTLQSYSDDVEFESFEELFSKFEYDLNEFVKFMHYHCVLGLLESDEKSYKKKFPCSVISLFVHSCVEKGLSYSEGSATYRVLSPHIGGVPDVVNSLYAIKKAVFEDKIITFKDLMKVLRNNWEENEELRKKILTDYIYYGNDNDEIDNLSARILNDFSDMCSVYDQRTPVRFVSGVSSFGRQLRWTEYRLATAYGRKKGEILAGNLSPTPGTDLNGASSIIKSYCKADLKKQYTGAALDLGFVPTNISSENAITAIAGLIKGFVILGGSFLQIDTIDKSVLIDAQQNPDNYRNLSVRVTGWNARFVTMTKPWQDMIIERTK